MKKTTMLLMCAAALAAACATESTTTKREPESPSNEPVGSTVTSEQNDAIDAVFRRKAPQLQRCWQEEYERTKNRALEGEITVNMTISKAGKPVDLKVAKSSIGVAAVDKCVLDEIGSWSFAEGPGDAPYRRTVHLGSAY